MSHLGKILPRITLNLYDLYSIDAITDNFCHMSVIPFDFYKSIFTITADLMHYEFGLMSVPARTSAMRDIYHADGVYSPKW